MDLKEYVKEYRPHIDEVLETLIDERELDRYNRQVYKEIKRFLLSPGKRIRPILVIIGYETLSGKKADQNIIRVSTIYEILHAYLLIHDDIIDRDELRRGQPTLWKGIEDSMREIGLVSRHQAFSLGIIAGDILRTKIEEVLNDADLKDSTKWRVMRFISYIDELTNRGQVLDVSLSFVPFQAVTERDILNIYLYKTAYYSFYGPLGTGALLSERNEEIFKDYAIPLGIAFQIKDDILGVFGDPEVTGKPADSDIKEGKRTLLLWYAWNHSTPKEKSLLEKVVGNPDATAEEINEVKDIIKSTGALEYANIKANEYMEKSLHALEEMDIRDEYRELLESFARYMVQREK